MGPINLPTTAEWRHVQQRCGFSLSSLQGSQRMIPLFSLICTRRQLDATPLHLYKSKRKTHPTPISCLASNVCPGPRNCIIRPPPLTNGTNALSQAGLASASFSLRKWYVPVKSNNLYSLESSNFDCQFICRG